MLRSWPAHVHTPPLAAGDHLDQATFHARYAAMPPDFRAELIGGVVSVRDNATAIFRDDSEPQPDVSDAFYAAGEDIVRKDMTSHQTLRRRTQ